LAVAEWVDGFAAGLATGSVAALAAGTCGWISDWTCAGAVIGAVLLEQLLVGDR